MPGSVSPPRDHGLRLHQMAIRTYLSKIGMVLKGSITAKDQSAIALFSKILSLVPNLAFESPKFLIEKPFRLAPILDHV